MEPAAGREGTNIAIVAGAVGRATVDADHSGAFLRKNAPQAAFPNRRKATAGIFCKVIATEGVVKAQTPGPAWNAFASSFV